MARADPSLEGGGRRIFMAMSDKERQAKRRGPEGGGATREIPWQVGRFTRGRRDTLRDTLGRDTLDRDTLDRDTLRDTLGRDPEIADQACLRCRTCSATRARCGERIGQVARPNDSDQNNRRSLPQCERSGIKGLR
jgi:hypothetical protein